MRFTPAAIADLFAEVEKHERQVVEVHLPNQAAYEITKFREGFGLHMTDREGVRLWGARVLFFDDPESVFLLDNTGKLHWMPAP